MTGMSTSEATLAMHPHAFAVLVLQRPADERFSVDMAHDHDVDPRMVLAMLRGIVVKMEREIQG